MEPNNTRSNRIVWALSLALAAVFMAAGIGKLAQVPILVEKFEGWGYPEPLLLLAGTIEVIGAVLLVIPRLASIGAIALGTVMLGAIYTHLFRGIPWLAVVPLGTLALLVFVSRRRLDSPLQNRTKTHVPPQWNREEAPRGG